jgi:hypothetical protein
VADITVFTSNDKGFFFGFYIATSCGRIVVKPTVDSINTNAEWFFASFTRVTGTDSRSFFWPELESNVIQRNL